MTMQLFTGRDYLKIDIANNFGHDKLTWDERISWFDENEHQLDSLLKQAEAPALYYAGVQAWKGTNHGQPVHYPISLDATASGIQILAALAGDRRAAALCNVVDTGRREDAYTGIYEVIVNKLGEAAKINRKDTKRAIMTSFYGSTAQPRDIFGKGELLDCFYDTMQELAPGAWEINETMLKIWNPEATEYNWVLPDNFHVRTKVTGTVKENVHFLNQPFEVRYKENLPTKEGRSLGANMTHSVDGMVVREMARRCMYDLKKVQEIAFMLKVGTKTKSKNRSQDHMVQTLWSHYEESGFLSARILDYLDGDNFGLVPHQVIEALILSLPEKPFELVSVHDCFRCLPNYGNDLRRQYNRLLAEIANSDLLSFLVSQIVGHRVQVSKLDQTLPQDILEANYALS